MNLHINTFSSSFSWIPHSHGFCPSPFCFLNCHLYDQDFRLLFSQFSSEDSLRSLSVPTVSLSLSERHAEMSCSSWVSHSSLTDLTTLIISWVIAHIVSNKNSSSSTIAPLEYQHKLVTSRPFCRWLSFYAIVSFPNLGKARIRCITIEHDSLRLLLRFKTSCYPVLWHKLLWRCKGFCDIQALARSLSFLPVSNVLRKVQAFTLLNAKLKNGNKFELNR